MWPDGAQLEQTLCTLRFAARMGRVECTPVNNNERVGRRSRSANDVLAAKLRQEVDALRSELSAIDLIAGKPPPEYAYGTLAANEVRLCRQHAETYVRSAGAEYTHTEASALFLARGDATRLATVRTRLLLL